MIEHYHKWYSQFFDRDFEMLVFGETGIPIIVFPSTLGRYYTPKDLGFIHSLQELINSNKIKVYCPDSIVNQTWLNFNISPATTKYTKLNFDRIKNANHRYMETIKCC